MIDWEGKVIPADEPEAIEHSECVRDCLREALTAHIIGDYNIVKARLKDAQKSIDRLDKLIQYRETMNLAKEFATAEALEQYEMHMAMMAKARV